MKDTQDESAALKQALKHSPMTPELKAEAEIHFSEAEEALQEVKEGYESCSPSSWVAHELE